MNAVEYTGSDGSRLFIQYEIAEGQEVIDETFQYRMRNPDRMIAVRLLHEHNGVKTVTRLTPGGADHVLTISVDNWAEPVTQFLTTVHTQPIVVNPS